MIPRAFFVVVDRCCALRSLNDDCLCQINVVWVTQKKSRLNIVVVVFRFMHYVSVNLHRHRETLLRCVDANKLLLATFHSAQFVQFNDSTSSDVECRPDSLCVSQVECQHAATDYDNNKVILDWLNNQSTHTLHTFSRALNDTHQLHLHNLLQDIQGNVVDVIVVVNSGCLGLNPCEVRQLTK